MEGGGGGGDGDKRLARKGCGNLAKLKVEEASTAKAGSSRRGCHLS